MTNAEKFREVFGDAEDLGTFYCAGFKCNERTCEECERAGFWDEEYRAPKEEVK